MTEKKQEITLTDEERQPVECYTRIMGYYRPETEANIGKRQEIKERKHFNIKEEQC